MAWSHAHVAADFTGPCAVISVQAGMPLGTVQLDLELDAGKCQYRIQYMKFGARDLWR
jgi:hypothetical protein